MLETPANIAPLLAKPVAVLGGGRSGEAVLALLKKLGARGILYDEKLPHAEHTFPEGGLSSPSGLGEEGGLSARRRTESPPPPPSPLPHRLVIFSPGFPPDHKWLAAARAAGCELLGELDFASLFWRGRIVAITGTNGKTTLTEFLTHALRSIGREAHATGNIGDPFTALVNRLDSGTPGTTAVVEVSSFQSETLKHFRADSALWTNFAEDHLERHPTLRAYYNAKHRLLDLARPHAILLAGPSVARHAPDRAPWSAVAKRSDDTALSASQNFPTIVPTETQPPDPLLAGTVFEHYPQRENFLLAAAWWCHSGLPETALYSAAHSFKLGRHRLQRIATINNVAYWNDSKATNFHAVEAALANFPAAPATASTLARQRQTVNSEPGTVNSGGSSPTVHLILGGLAKGGDIPAFVRRIAPKIKHAHLIGSTAPSLADACRAANIPHTAHATLADAVRAAAARALPGDAVLLSPAFASFDMFRGYEDRGNQFEQLVAQLATAPTPRASA